MFLECWHVWNRVVARRDNNIVKPFSPKNLYIYVYVHSKRRQIIIIDWAFPRKSGPRFGSTIRQVEKVDSEQGFRFHNFDFLFFGVR